MDLKALATKNLFLDNRKESPCGSFFRVPKGYTALRFNEAPAFRFGGYRNAGCSAAYLTE